MKKTILASLSIITILLLSNCGNYNDPASQIEGVWDWTYAVNAKGEDLMQQYDYKTATFNADGTYAFDIGTTSHDGNWSVDEAGEYLNIDGAQWEILKLSSSELQIKKEYEWHFEK